MSSEILTGLSFAELEALADGLLAPAHQARLDGLVSRNGQCSLGDLEQLELDRLLDSADQLTIPKTRARYTLGAEVAQPFPIERRAKTEPELSVCRQSADPRLE